MEAADDDVNGITPSSPLKNGTDGSVEAYHEEDEQEEERRKWARENLNDKSFNMSFDDDGMTTATTATRVEYHEKPVIILSRKTCWLLTLAHFAMAVATGAIWITIFVVSSTRESDWGALWKGIVCSFMFLMTALAGVIIAMNINFRRAQVFLVCCVLSAVAALLLLILASIAVKTSVRCLVAYSTALVDIYRCQSVYYVKMLNVGYILIALVELVISLWPIVVGRRMAKKRKGKTVVTYEDLEFEDM